MKEPTYKEIEEGRFDPKIKWQRFLAYFLKKFVRMTHSVQVYGFNFPNRIWIARDRTSGWRDKECKTCRWKANITNGKWDGGDERYHCRGLGYQFFVAEKTDACPRYES